MGANAVRYEVSEWGEVVDTHDIRREAPCPMSPYEIVDALNADDVRSGSTLTIKYEEPEPERCPKCTEPAQDYKTRVTHTFECPLRHEWDGAKK